MPNPCPVHMGLSCACSPRPMPMWGSEIEAENARKAEMGWGGGGSDAVSAAELEAEVDTNLAASPALEANALTTPVFSSPGFQPTEESRLEAVGPRAPYRGPSSVSPAPAGAPAGMRMFVGGLSGRALGTLPTLPTVPEPPYVRAPIPPPTPGYPGPGMVRAGRGHRVPQDQASRFLALAEGAMVAIRNALDQAASATAKPRDRHAAWAVFDCMQSLGEKMTTFAAALLELRAALKEQRAASLLSVHLRAIEDFAACAAQVQGRQETQVKADAAVGSAIPMLALAGLLL